MGVRVWTFARVGGLAAQLVDHAVRYAADADALRLAAASGTGSVRIAARAAGNLHLPVRNKTRPKGAGWGVWGVLTENHYTPRKSYIGDPVIIYIIFIFKELRIIIIINRRGWGVWGVWGV